MEHTLDYAVGDLTGKKLEFNINNFLLDLELEIGGIAREKRRGFEIDKNEYIEKIRDFRSEIRGMEKALGYLDLLTFLKFGINFFDDYIEGRHDQISTMFFVTKDEEIYQKSMSFTPEQLLDARKDVDFRLKIVYTSEEYLKFTKYFHPDWSVEEEEEF